MNQAVNNTSYKPVDRSLKPYKVYEFTNNMVVIKGYLTPDYWVKEVGSDDIYYHTMAANENVSNTWYWRPVK